MKPWGTIAVGTRIGDGRCDPLFFRSWTRLMTGGLRAGDTALDPVIELPHHIAANIAVQYFLQSGADTLCMIDSDMAFPHDTLAALRNDADGMEYDILCALCTTRRAPNLPVMLRRVADRDGVPSYQPCPELITGRPVVVDAVGLPFCLIRREVFDGLSEFAPWWFDWGERGLGEDTMFSQRAIAAGFKIAVHTGVSIEHRGTVGFVWEAENKRTGLRQFNQIGKLLE